MSKHAEERLVLSVPEPKFTDTWHPIKHSKVVDAVNSAVDKIGFGVIKKNYSLSNDDQDMFGVWVLDNEEHGINWSLGFRNSIKKHFAVGICAGTHIMVCSNMMFDGEFIEFRRHTGRLEIEELNEITFRAVKEMENKVSILTKWHNDLNKYEIKNEFIFKQMTYDAMSCDIFAPSKFHDFVSLYEEEREVNKNETFFTFHGACTRILRKYDFFQVNDRSVRLKKLMDDYINNAAVQN